MNSILILISQIITIYIWILVAAVIISWLIAFNVVNLQNRFVASIYDILNKLTEPLLAPIRRVLPDLGGIDISPVVLILGLIFLRNILFELFGGGLLIR